MAPPTPPPAPIIKRTHSPHPHSPAAVSNAALKSPQFVDQPTHPSLGGSTSPISPPTTGYFSPQPAHSGSAVAPHSPNPSGILINRGENARSPDHLHLQGTAGGAQNAGLGILRVASPDGSTSESGLSSASFGAAGDGTASTAPSSAVGSPTSPGAVGGGAKPLLSTLHVSEQDGQAGTKRTGSSPPSPHCHFAPLPKVDNEARPGTRRNSFANRVKPYKGPPERSDSMASSVGDDDSSPFSPALSPPYSSHHPHGDSSIPTPSALSQRLSSSLTFATPPTAAHSHSTHSPSRPTSRRSSSSRRSRSPSPPPRSSSRSGGGGAGGTTGGIYRSHSPNLSRHASTDALSLHYIEAGAERERGGAALSRTSSRAGSERDGGVSSAIAAAGGEEGGAFLRRGPSVERTRSSSNSPFFLAGAGSSASDGPKDKDKEADLHRLEKKALEGNVDAERAVSPALRMREAREAARERSTSRGAVAVGEEVVPVPVLKRKASNEEVVTVGPGEEKDPDQGALEEVVEEEEEEEEVGGTDEEEEGNTATDEEEEEGTTDEEEEEDEVERSRDEDDEEDEEDEEEDEQEEEEMEERKTSKGAAVEVVRWHRPERDEPSPAPAPPVLAAPPTASAPVSPRPSVGLSPPSSLPTSVSPTVAGSGTASPALPQEGIAH